MTDQLTAWLLNGYLTAWLTDCLRAFWGNAFTYTLKYYVTIILLSKITDQHT